MADEEAKPAAGAGKKDIRFDYLCERVCSTLKVKDEQFQKLLQAETRWGLSYGG